MLATQMVALVQNYSAYYPGPIAMSMKADSV